MALTDNEYSTPKITPADGVQIPSVGSSSGYQLDEELREYIQEGVTGVTEEYSTLMTYAYGKRLKHEGVEYRCIVPVESPEIFDPDKWVKVDLTELDKRVLENASAINAISVKIGNLKETSFELASNASYEFDIDYFSTVLISSARSGSSDSSLFFVAPNTVSAIFNNDNPISVSYGSGTHITISNLTARSLGIHIIYMKV